ncbi:MAG: hypothetical protein QNJ46_25885 [Leptolyngbyaceae cyanobacterium MO_188.B28]|nr:hypothetical protein [Leptolyngbyaceae cyanobacterium MO_188.B28]
MAAKFTPPYAWLQSSDDMAILRRALDDMQTGVVAPILFAVN